MAVGGISFPTPQAFSGGVDWSPLANLGNVYQAGQDRNRKLSALAQLGNDPTANAQVLIRSGDPTLAAQGINMQSQQAARDEQVREFNAQQQIRQAEEHRRQKDWEEQDPEAAAAAISKLFPNQPAPAAAPSAAATSADVFTRGATPIAPSPGLPSAPPTAQLPTPPGAAGQPAVPLAPGAAPPDAQAVPLAPAVPPSPVAPDQLQATGAMSARVPVADRVVNNLTTGQPAAASGITRDQIKALYTNPLTRPLATTFLQNALNPGTWKVEKTEDGRIVAVNDKTLESKDVTPPTTTGGQPATKQEREYQGYYQSGKNLGMTDAQAQAFAANKGKTPKEDLTPSEEKRVNTLTDQVQTAQRTLGNVAQLRELSKTAWGFPGAGKLSEYASVLPRGLGGAGATDTQDLINAAHSNVANVAKSIFPQRVTNTDLNLLKQLESSADQPDTVRQRIYDRTEAMFNRMISEAQGEAESIRNKTFYKPGGVATSAPAEAAPAAAPTAAPTAAPRVARNPVEAEMMKRGLLK